MRLSRVSRSRRNGLGRLASRTLILVVFGLSACATHRTDPPKCKGPFTPINQSSPVVSNGTQR